ncbi:MAG TPA: SigB/SigF/SigG family RNA polymerase sigma factor [Actinomycetota bacterium]|nr:SigB/SigF/SigG family RNA polymerase sigma factor [Actinomycetota bacterium]
MTALAELDDSALFAKLPDDRARETLLVRHRPLALYLARRFQGRGESLEDLEQVAAMALLKAIDRLDPKRELKFSTFATITIIGELKRHLRDRGWAIRVPRPIQELAVLVTRCVGTMTQALGRSPTVPEIAEQVGEPPEKVLEALDASRVYTTDSLDTPVGVDDQAPVDRLAEHDERFDRLDSWQSIAPLLAHLPERERRILYLRFFEERTQSEIADELGISQMHVSRLLSRTLSGLRHGSSA